ncbi:MAG: nucleotidyl transferase AbiEii/AbiGii toxin family protein [Actinomycetia bacterium]|nr:nucleotidyl transferase AbiEii/AbiGii toxin family protein [Actinomycetes bacterium]
MIPTDAITAWSVNHPWPTTNQVEQDLLLSRAICEIANHEVLGTELLFRGGTAFHKLHLPQPYRYSEDLDYVRTSAGGIQHLTRALTDLGSSLGYTVRTRISQHPKIYWRTVSGGGTPLRIKIEINTHERSPALPPMTIPFSVQSPWWTGHAHVPTFQLAELIATKIRALYQRSKGRDLFDLWLALTQAHADPKAIIQAFHPYRPTGLNARLAITNLETKLHDARFTADLEPLVTKAPANYSVERAAHQVIEELLELLE